MAGFEQTIIVGNVGRDPESRFLPSGQQVTNFSVAVTTRWRDRDTNEQREKTNWYRCNAWGRQAEVTKEYIRKGTQVMVKGTPEAKSYIGQDGEARSSLELRVETFQLLDSRGGNSGNGNGQSTPEDTVDIPF